MRSLGRARDLEVKKGQPSQRGKAGTGQMSVSVGGSTGNGHSVTDQALGHQGSNFPTGSQGTKGREVIPGGGNHRRKAPTC